MQHLAKFVSLFSQTVGFRLGGFFDFVECLTVGRRFSKFCALLFCLGLSLKGIVERRDEFVNLRSK